MATKVFKNQGKRFCRCEKKLYLCRRNQNLYEFAPILRAFPHIGQNIIYHFYSHIHKSQL